jgi:5-enolpyruvylshikimate-3-phosphate synthase
MLGAVAGLASGEGVRVAGAGAVDVSFPGFYTILEALRREAAVVEPDRR